MGKLFSILCLALLFACKPAAPDLSELFSNPPQEAKPWVFWYWMNAAVSKEGITADLEAMSQSGIGGAYLMPIKGVADPVMFEPAAPQLSPLWWEMVVHAFKEADRLGLKIAMHASDGFALAGGPWIKPEMSMQVVVWADTLVDGSRLFDARLPQPPMKEGYYKDIAVFAYPERQSACYTSYDFKPVVTTNIKDADASQLAVKGNDKTFKSEDSCWIQYAFSQPFTCRSVVVKSNNNYQSNRLIIETSDDGRNFHRATRLEVPRHGWQDTDADYTHAIAPVTARYFRFVFDNKGSEPGSEDLDAAKWKPVLKLKELVLSSQPRIDHFEGKAGLVWRMSGQTPSNVVADSLCVSLDKMIDVSSKMQADGHLKWEMPAGKWRILRIGHTSNGHTNYTGGAALGLECDKFNPEVVKLQFDSWFGEALKYAGSDMVGEVLSTFHVDSWECGSQNWSPVFLAEFNKRRHYDLKPYLPVMAGIPVVSVEMSEKVLQDVRLTISELVHDNFYGVMAAKCREAGVNFTAESVAPTMMSDGLLHYNQVDVPMGEFWLNSPTHDKPNDMLDAMSGAHIYGKQIAQAEAFTTVRMDWSEHPAMLKNLGDRNYALGVNRMVYHVYTHNPWMDRKPGMTLDGVGLCFQRDQTWWKPGSEWVKYAQRCQALLQQGNHVADVAVFIGEDLPRRSVLPNVLVDVLPGIIGGKRVEAEKMRLLNEGLPLCEKPAGVRASANIYNPADWVDPLNGYAYDSFNPDALLRLATIKNGRVSFGGHSSYGVLVLPGVTKMSPNGDYMSARVAVKLLELINQGANVVVGKRPSLTNGITDTEVSIQQATSAIDQIWSGPYNDVVNDAGKTRVKKLGNGKVVLTPYLAADFSALGLNVDLRAFEQGDCQADNIAWTHRKGADFDLYFISNQLDSARVVNLSLRAGGCEPEIFDPVSGAVFNANQWMARDGMTHLPVSLDANGSLFVVLRHKTNIIEKHDGNNWMQYKAVQTINAPWSLQFDPKFGGPATHVVMDSLQWWNSMDDASVKYYSGTTVYSSSFNVEQAPNSKQHCFVNLGEVACIAEVSVNGKSCGIAWTSPWRVDVTDAVKKGENRLSIAVTNTWANRMIGDQLLSPNERLVNTTAPYRLEGKPLLNSGLRGPVLLEIAEQ